MARRVGAGGSGHRAYDDDHHHLGGATRGIGCDGGHAACRHLRRGRGLLLVVARRLASGECWVEAENPATGTVLFSGTLFSGQSHIVSASGPVVVIAGAPGAFVATINGVPVTLPPGYQAPFTLTFQTPGAGGDASSAPTTTSTT